MQFGDPYFWLFFGAVYSVHVLVRRSVNARNLVLLIASYLLYTYWSGFFALLLAASSLIAYAVGRALPGLSEARKKLLLTGTVIFFLLVLAGYKYAAFIAATIGIPPSAPLFGRLEHLALPLGISFYTFQIISYLTDVRRGKVLPERHLIRFLLFIAFFPKIVAGPLERAATFLPQLSEKRVDSLRSFGEGAYLIVWGLVQKYCIADNAATLVQILLFRHRTDLSYAMSGPLAAAVQIFADFSGYSDMARGMARLLGFELSWNFRMPYLATGPADFWKRWHISLSEWFRDYVYIPLGGNRKGLLRTNINLLATMTLVGLWHGAAWPFILWGVYQGALLVTYGTLEKTNSPMLHRIGTFLNRTHLSRPIFFVLTVIGWLMFISPSLNIFMELMDLRRLVTFDTHMPELLLLALPLVAMHAVQLWNNDLLAVPHGSFRLQVAFYWVAFYMLMVMPHRELQNFIYVRF